MKPKQSIWIRISHVKTLRVLVEETAIADADANSMRKTEREREPGMGAMEGAQEPDEITNQATYRVIGR